MIFFVFSLDIPLRPITMSQIVTFHTGASKLSESCVWITERNRYICLTYEYWPGTGCVKYAASVLKGDLADDYIRNHEETTTRRFEIRPVTTYFETFLDYDGLIKMIRKEMCHGAGCVGPRKMIPRSDDTESLVSEDFISEEDSEETFTVSMDTHMSPDVFTFKYTILTSEKHGNANLTLRIIYGCYKGSEKNNEIIYGATIHHSPVYHSATYDIPELDDDAHYETALMRMEKCPVHMRVKEEFSHQLNRDANHREDLMYCILDKIYAKIGGLYQIRGNRY